MSLLALDAAGAHEATAHVGAGAAGFQKGVQLFEACFPGFTENHPAEHVRQVGSGEDCLGDDLEITQPRIVLAGRAVDNGQLVSDGEGLRIQVQQKHIAAYSVDGGVFGANDIHEKRGFITLPLAWI